MNAVSPANVDINTVYLWRTATADRVLEFIVRVIQHDAPDTATCDILSHRVFNVAEPPPQWTNRGPGVRTTLSLIHDLGPVTVWST
jgi:hypothetical protein